MADKPEQPLPDEWVRVFDDMVLVQQRTEAERDALRAQLVDLGKAYETRLNDWHALRAENERLRTALTNADAAGEALVKAGVDFAKENERLRAALTHYGRHQLLCSFFKNGPHQASPETICNCGLVAAYQT